MSMSLLLWVIWYFQKCINIIWQYTIIICKDVRAISSPRLFFFFIQLMTKTGWKKKKKSQHHFYFLTIRCLLRGEGELSHSAFGCAGSDVSLHSEHCLREQTAETVNVDRAGKVDTRVSLWHLMHIQSLSVD